MEAALNLEIPTELAAQGRVLAPDGTPVAGARVEFWSLQESSDCVMRASARADAGEDGASTR